MPSGRAVKKGAYIARPRGAWYFRNKVQVRFCFDAGSSGGSEIADTQPNKRKLTMPMRITIIGAGPGGYTAAFEAAKAGAEVTLVESALLGGTCLNCGCIPTKTLKASAEALETARRAAEFGLAGTCDLKADMPAIVARKRRVSDTLRGGLEKTCAKLKVRVVTGRGQVISASLVRVRRDDGSVEEIAGDRVIIATGSSTLNLPSLPVDHTHILTSDDALELDHVPSSIIIVGGGVIGTELAFIYRAFGSRVTVVEGQTRILPVPGVDRDMSALIQREMKKAGIAVELCRTVNATETRDGAVVAHLGPSPFLPEDAIPAAARKEGTLEAEAVFVTVGRVPNTDGLGLAEAGIASIRMDFPGCGDSTEPFTENTLSNMMADSNASKDYLVANYPVDADRLGILGYSMGGRLALEIITAEGNPYQAAVLLSGVSTPGEEAVAGILPDGMTIEEAIASAEANGSFDYTTQYGQNLSLSAQWFEDMMVDPLANIDNYTGPMLVIHGDKDDVVDDATNKLTVSAYPSAQEVIVPDADHGYGFYSDQPEVTAMVEGTITDFFTEHLAAPAQEAAA